MRKILKDPLVHFLALGLGLFVLFNLVASDEAAYDAVRYDTEMSDDVLMTTTERAYTSPIWYTP